MKTRKLAHRLLLAAAAATVMLVGTAVTEGQGTITFDGASNFSGTNYYQSGMWFHVVVPGGFGYDDMGGVPQGGFYGNLPNNPTPFLIFYQQHNPYDYVALSLTNGALFGLNSAQLADPSSPSSSMLPISFVGFKADGSTVTNIFTTPGGGADHLLNYQFDSAFSSGLASVKIDATRWAMDNLVFTVPEPGIGSLLALGLSALVARKARRTEDPG